MHNEEHRQITIDRTNAADRLAFLRGMADNARSHGDREGAARLDLVAEDLSACIAAGWRHRFGRPVDHWELNFRVSSLGNGTSNVRMHFRPVRRAA
jgi:hypothetical protein